MAHIEEMLVNGILTPVVKFDHSAQEIDDAVEKIPESGVAPAGFGLGVNSYTAITANEIDGLNKTGIYWYLDDNVSIYEDGWNSGKKGWLIHIQGDSNNVLGSYQKFIPYNPVMQVGTGGNYCALERRGSDTGWKPWEWLNPPMQVGVEYRTTDRYMGKPVYVMLAEFGANENDRSVYFGENVDKVVSGVACDGGGSLYPFYGGNTANAWTGWFDFLSANDPTDGIRKVKVTAYTGSSMSGVWATNYALIRYTKSND